jgi:glycosyltransferase involved in cell wall biosynthesis
MKKIINFYFPCIEDGGLEKNAFELVNSLAQKNYKINFFTYEDLTKNKKLKKKFFFHKKINLITSNLIPGINNRNIKYLLCSLKLFFICLRNEGLILSYQGNVLPIIIARITGKKIVIRLNTAPSKYIDNYLKKKFFKYIYSFSNLILVTSNDFKKEIKKYFDLESCVHRQSLDREKIIKESKLKLKFNFFSRFQGLKIINVGRLTYQKNQLTLLKAFSKLIKKRNSRLLFIGDGNDKSDLLRFINQKKLNQYVRIIPFTNNPFKYIAMSDVKVLSSRFEGNPNILLEVACLKKPIISSDCKVGPREILRNGKGGLMFKVGDFNKLYYLLKNIKIKSKKIKTKVDIAYNYVDKNYKKDISIPFIQFIKNL